MRMIRHFVLFLAIAATSLALAAGKPAAKKTGSEHVERQSIAAIVASSPDFKTLGAALASAGLSEGLNGSGSQPPASYTLFGPTEAAFAKLPAGTVDGLLKPENHDKLVAILNYHLMPQKVVAKQLLKLKLAPTVNGDPLVIAVEDKQLTIDGAHVLKTDIQASNGVIHAIDTVLMPDGK